MRPLTAEETKVLFEKLSKLLVYCVYFRLNYIIQIIARNVSKLFL